MWLLSFRHAQNNLHVRFTSLVPRLCLAPSRLGHGSRRTRTCTGYMISSACVASKSIDALISKGALIKRNSLTLGVVRQVKPLGKLNQHYCFHSLRMSGNDTDCGKSPCSYPGVFKLEMKCLFLEPIPETLIVIVCYVVDLQPRRHSNADRGHAHTILFRPCPQDEYILELA